MTGNNNKDFLGLDAIIDDGTSVSTYGGLSRTTYSTLNSTRTASGGTLTLLLMGQLYDAAAKGNEKPTMILCNETVWTLYEQLLTPTVRAGYDASGYPQVTRTGTAVPKGSLKGMQGFDSISFRGTPVVRDEKCTAQTMWFVNENLIHFYGANSHPKYQKVNLGSSNIEGPYSDAPNSFGMFWTGLKEPTNQDASIGQFILYGNLLSPNPNRHSRLTGITTV